MLEVLERLLCARLETRNGGEETTDTWPIVSGVCSMLGLGIDIRYGDVYGDVFCASTEGGDLRLADLDLGPRVCCAGREIDGGGLRIFLAEETDLVDARRFAVLWVEVLLLGVDVRLFPPSATGGTAGNGTLGGGPAGVELILPERRWKFGILRRGATGRD